MSKQRHDQGHKKRLSGQKPMARNRLVWQRVKRRHPGPLPWYIASFSEWLDKGKPKK